MSPYDDSTDPGKLVLFRKVFHIQNTDLRECIVQVSADTHYRLFVNGNSVSVGPCKSYPSRWYYETVDIAAQLVPGKNVISAKVLRYSSAHARNSSMMRTNLPSFFLHGTVNASGFINHSFKYLNTNFISENTLQTYPTWSAKEDSSIQITPRSDWDYALGPPFMCINERVDA